MQYVKYTKTVSLQKKLQIVWQIIYFGQKSKNTTTKQKHQHKNPCQSQELNPGPLAPKADALPLYHRVN